MGLAVVCVVLTSLLVLAIIRLYRSGRTKAHRASASCEGIEVTSDTAQPTCSSSANLEVRTSLPNLEVPQELKGSPAGARAIVHRFSSPRIQTPSLTPLRSPPRYWPLDERSSNGERRWSDAEEGTKVESTTNATADEEMRVCDTTSYSDGTSPTVLATSRLPYYVRSDGLHLAGPSCIVDSCTAGSKTAVACDRHLGDGGSDASATAATVRSSHCSSGAHEPANLANLASGGMCDYNRSTRGSHRDVSNASRAPDAPVVATTEPVDGVELQPRGLLHAQYDQAPELAAQMGLQLNEPQTAEQTAGMQSRSSGRAASSQTPPSQGLPSQGTSSPGLGQGQTSLAMDEAAHSQAAQQLDGAARAAAATMLRPVGIGRRMSADL